MIDVIVISLTDATERRQSVERQLGSAGVRFEFYDAVRGDTAFREGHLEDRDTDEWLLNCGRHPTDGEFGCFASHRNVWKLCAERDRPVLIMEDDFRMLDDFASAVEQADQNVKRFGFLRLQTETRAHHVHVQDAGRFDICRYTYAPHSLMCYAIAPRVARRWVELTRTASEPVDIFVKKFWLHGQPLFGLSPYTVTESALSIATSIRGRDRPKKSLATSLRRLGRKVRWAVARFLFNFRLSRADAGRELANSSSVAKHT